MFCSKDVIYMLMLHLKLFLISHGIKFRTKLNCSLSILLHDSSLTLSLRARLAFGQKQLKRWLRAPSIVLMYIVALLFPAAIYFRSEKYKISIFF